MSAEEEKEFIHKPTSLDVSQTRFRVAPSQDCSGGLNPYPPGLDLVLSVRVTLLSPRGRES